MFGWSCDQSHRTFTPACQQQHPQFSHGLHATHRHSHMLTAARFHLCCHLTISRSLTRTPALGNPQCGHRNSLGHSNMRCFTRFSLPTYEQRIHTVVPQLKSFSMRCKDSERLPNQLLQGNPRVGALPTPPALLPAHTQRTLPLSLIIRLHCLVLLGIPGRLSTLVNDDV